MKSRTVGRAYALTVGIILLSLTFANAATAGSEQATRQYLVPAFGAPDVAKATIGGDTVTITGTGTFTPGEKDASGGGTFIHKNSLGAVLATGTWSAEGLISWTSFGLAGAGFPPGFEGGVVVLKVHLTPSGGAGGDAITTRLAPSSEGEQHEGGLEAVLKISCLLGSPPSGAFEGINLNVMGGPNFDKNVSGNTVFIQTPED